MKCLSKYKWVKVPRDEIPDDTGILIYYLRLASRAAFRKGFSRYCGHKNAVEAGSWAGGIVGLKSILKAKSRRETLEIMDELKMLGYIDYTIDPSTKKLTYSITDWVIKCSGKECPNGNVYTTPKYGFLCMPRNITERLVEKGHIFGEADAWLDLWCHTVFRDKGNAFSFLSPVIQYGKYGSMLTLEKLGNRWGWEKTKVWRFFQKFAPYFQLYRLPGSYGCVIYSLFYPVCDEIELPEEEAVMRIFRKIRICAQNTHTEGTINEKGNRYTAWKSRCVIDALEEKAQNQYGETAPIQDESGAGVALSALYNARVIFSCKNCKNSRNCIHACRGIDIGKPVNLPTYVQRTVRSYEGRSFFGLDTS